MFAKVQVLCWQGTSLDLANFFKLVFGMPRRINLGEARGGIGYGGGGSEKDSPGGGGEGGGAAVCGQQTPIQEYTTYCPHTADLYCLNCGCLIVCQCVYRNIALTFSHYANIA